jgi:phosphate transport system permease protein
MGFAVIPIIFTLSEDALSSVPRSLTSASLACGASPWQTAWRVVLPTASPGIFSAVMVGLGRAIGETMIVLMATGNTPVLDWSPFNGMRTLAANIAVEIPEAPHHGSLYRVLFLAAFLLFLLTFALNTLAELVRQRLRKKYESFG